MARNIGIRHIAEIKRISIKKVLSVLVNFNQEIKTKQSKYKSLQVDEFGLLWIKIKSVDLCLFSSNKGNCSVDIGQMKHKNSPKTS